MRNLSRRRASELTPEELATLPKPKGKPAAKKVPARAPARKSAAAKRSPGKRKRPAKPKVVEMPAPAAAEPEGPPSVYAATLARLTAVGMAGDPHAVVVLALASKLDAGHESGASMAALARQHASGMDAVLGRAKVPDDPMDELAARRDAKLGSA